MDSMDCFKNDWMSYQKHKIIMTTCILKQELVDGGSYVIAYRGQDLLLRSFDLLQDLLGVKGYEDAFFFLLLTQFYFVFHIVELEDLFVLALNRITEGRKSRFSVY